MRSRNGCRPTELHLLRLRSQIHLLQSCCASSVAPHQISMQSITTPRGHGRSRRRSKRRVLRTMRIGICRGENISRTIRVSHKVSK